MKEAYTQHALDNAVIFINIPTPDKRLITEQLYLKDVVLEGTTLQAPVFPAADVAAISGNAELAPAAKSAAIKKLLDDHTTRQKEFERVGGLSINEQVALGVRNWLVENKGFSNSNADGDKPYIALDQLDVTTSNLNGTLLFHVAGAAVWGC